MSQMAKPVNRFSCLTRSSTHMSAFRKSRSPVPDTPQANEFSTISTLTANIRRRRGSKVCMNMPIFFDTNTPKPFIDPAIPWDRNLFPGDSEAKNGAALPDHIYMDAMGFGMGCSCLQITFQASNVDEARRVYDSLIPVGPIMVS